MLVTTLVIPIAVATAAIIVTESLIRRKENRDRRRYRDRASLSERCRIVIERDRADLALDQATRTHANLIAAAKAAPKIDGALLTRIKRCEDRMAAAMRHLSRLKTEAFFTRYGHGV